MIFERNDGQAHSQAFVSREANLYLRNHVVQNLRAYFTLHVITTKCTIGVQEKIELSSMSRRQKLS